MSKGTEEFVKDEWPRVQAGEKIFEDIVDKGTQHGADYADSVEEAADAEERKTLKAHLLRRNAAFVQGAVMIRHSARVTDRLEDDLKKEMGEMEAQYLSDLMFAGILKEIAEHGEELLDI